MPPRTYRDLTPDELDSLITPHAPVPKIPLGAQASREPAWRARMPTASDVRFIDPRPADQIDLNRLYLPDTVIRAGEQPDEAWLDSLIASPPQAPRALSAVAPGGATFEGIDTPQGRELVKARGMQVTSTPTDEDLLEALASERPATMPELGGDDELDALIAQESAAMDREGAQGATQPRRSREDSVRELFAPPTRAQGGLALLFDALLGTKTLDDVNARADQYKSALAQARMQDLAAGERSDERALDREMTDARLRETQRAHDQAMERAQASLAQRQERGLQVDERIRSEGAASRQAAGERADKYLQVRAPGTPGASGPAPVALLAQQANVPRATAQAYASGKAEGIRPEELERLQNFDEAWQGMSQQKQQESLKGVFVREGTTPDSVAAARDKKLQDPEQILGLKQGIDETGRDIARAARAWAKMSPQGKKAFAALVPEGNFESAVRQGLMSVEDQKLATDVQALANGLVKARAGSAVTGSEWKRVAGEIGFPMNDWAVFNSPEVIDHWIQRARQGWVGRVNNIRSVYGDLWKKGAPNAGP